MQCNTNIILWLFNSFSAMAKNADRNCGKSELDINYKRSCGEEVTKTKPEGQSGDCVLVESQIFSLLTMKLEFILLWRDKAVPRCLMDLSPPSIIPFTHRPRVFALLTTEPSTNPLLNTHLLVFYSPPTHPPPSLLPLHLDLEPVNCYTDGWSSKQKSCMVQQTNWTNE